MFLSHKRYLFLFVLIVFAVFTGAFRLYVQRGVLHSTVFLLGTFGAAVSVVAFLLWRRQTFTARTIRGIKPASHAQAQQNAKRLLGK